MEKWLGLGDIEEGVPISKSNLKVSLPCFLLMVRFIVSELNVRKLFVRDSSANFIDIEVYCLRYLNICREYQRYKTH